MAEPICEDEGLLQEWTPLTQLLQEIPLKIQRGLFSQNLNLTCVDVVPEFIALGTNLGFVYWYCRGNGLLQRLQFENSHCSVSCVKIMLFVDYMVAAGTDQGGIIVFQIPKVEPGLTQDQLKVRQKQIERFTINGLHLAQVTNIEWSPNEMKIFSGDKNGLVVLTEIDLSLHISKSMELINEQFEIVQLSYHQQVLLISTVYRSVICDGSKNWKVQQVGTKERKILGKFGATFCKFQHGVVIFASRPGHRLWLSNNSGVVQQTLIFKSATQSNSPKIQLINAIDKKEPYDTSFGKVLQFGDNKLITYNSEILYILHPGAVSVVSVLNNVRKILDLAVNENEVFILEGGRSLLRIGPLPDKYSLDVLCQPASRRTSFNLDEFAAKIKDTAIESIKKITKDLIPTNEQTSPNSPPALADEALELPPIVNLPAGLMPTILTGDNIEIHSSLPNQSFTSGNLPGQNSAPSFAPFNQDCLEEVITRPLRKRRNKKPKCLPNAQESESDTASNFSEDRLVWGIANDLSLSDESAMSQSHSSFSVLRDISSLLNQQKKSEKGNEDGMKASDTKSQTSLDTCESVSERLLLTSEMFRDEQEKTFARLANQSLFDSYNSEKSDNMSISLNMTTSSSVSSKISENLHSPSHTSDNSEVVSRAKSTESQSTDNFPNELQASSSECWRSKNNWEENSSQGDKLTGSSESSLSSRNSQRERLYPRWSDEGVAGTSTTDLPQTSACCTSDEPEVPIYTEDNHQESGFYESGVPQVLENGLLNCENELKDPIQGSDSTACDEAEPQEFDVVQFSQLENHITHKELVNGTTELKNETDFVAKTFLAEEPLSYGPPSGSSLFSSQPSSDFSSIPQITHDSQALLGDSADHWPQYKTPERIMSLAASNNYVVCTDVFSRLYYSTLGELTLSWKLLDCKAAMIRVSNDGSMVWLVNNKSAVELVNPMPNSPISSTTKEIARNVKTFAIDETTKDGLIVTLAGKIVHYSGESKKLSEDFIPCDYIIADVVYSGGLIMALTNDDTLLCKLPEENEFRIVNTSKKIDSFALGPENLLWVVDDKNNIYFSDDYTKDDPHWWQIHISDYSFQNSETFQNLCNKLNPCRTMVATNENSVWIFNKFAFNVCMNKRSFTGYIWEKVTSVKLLPGIQWHTLCAEEVSDRGRVWLLSICGNIFCTSPDGRDFQSIPVPLEENILCMATSLDTLWVLSESGRIYSRVGLTRSTLSGVSWKELKTPQVDNLKLIWISCGNDVAWACDIHGRTFIRIGSLHNTSTTDPAWEEVKGTPKDVQFEKVFVGSQLYMVWAVDKKRNLYVREGIFPNYQIGTSWLHVCGIEVADVTISTGVWILASNGRIYRRCGVTEKNWIGDYWKNIPGSLKMISASSTDELWGIGQENIIQKLVCNLKVLKGGKTEEEENKDGDNPKVSVSWEIVE